MLTLFKSRLFSSLCLFALLALGVMWAANRYIAPQHLFWKPLDINAPLGVATKAQLMKVSLGSRPACASMLEDEAAGFSFTLEEPKRTEKGCGWSMALTATRSNNISFAPSEMMALCPVHAASYIWLKQVNNHARDLLGSPLKRVHHFGTYSCRNIAGTNTLSEHAFANAWDVSGFQLEDGRMISVLKHWDAGDEKAQFLRRAHRSGCRVFRVILGPDYNAAHADHFHFDMGLTSSCR